MTSSDHVRQIVGFHKRLELRLGELESTAVIVIGGWRFGYDLLSNVMHLCVSKL